MAKIGLSLSIDVTKINKARLFIGKNGAKYLNLTTFVDIDQPDQYDNNGFITESLTKEEREQKVQLPILGNCKVFWSDAPQVQQQPPQQQYQPPQQAPVQQPQSNDFDEEIPF